MDVHAAPHPCAVLIVFCKSEINKQWTVYPLSIMYLLSSYPCPAPFCFPLSFSFSLVRTHVLSFLPCAVLSFRPCVQRTDLCDSGTILPRECSLVCHMGQDGRQPSHLHPLPSRVPGHLLLPSGRPRRSVCSTSTPLLPFL